MSSVESARVALQPLVEVNVVELIYFRASVNTDTESRAVESGSTPTTTRLDAQLGVAVIVATKKASAHRSPPFEGEERRRGFLCSPRSSRTHTAWQHRDRRRALWRSCRPDMR